MQIWPNYWRFLMLSSTGKPRRALHRPTVLYATLVYLRWGSISSANAFGIFIGIGSSISIGS